MHSLKDINPHISEVVFTFRGAKDDGTTIQRNGLERIVVEDNLIRHIEVRNKSD